KKKRFGVLSLSLSFLLAGGLPGSMVDVLMICCAHIVDTKVGLFVVPLINRKQTDHSPLSMGSDLFDRLIHGFESSATQRGNTLPFGKVGVATSGSLFVPTCPEHLMPSKEWEDVFLADFSKLRLALSQDEGSASIIPGSIESIPLAHNIIED
nr:hypothetical protein [Tanacetum cinerariifolium]